MQILIDFDATVVLNEYPFMGEEIDGAVEVLKQLTDKGHELILVTMREGHLLDEAEEWFAVRDIEIKYSNCNPTFETGSRKIYGHLIIDDKCLGIPLIHDMDIHKKPFVHWGKVETMLKERGII